MVALALSRTNRSSSRVDKLPSWRTLFAYWVAMSRHDDIKKLWERDDLSTREKFDAYLEGYLMAFDPYPVCNRQLFSKNDLHALLLDFFAVGDDMNKAAQKLVSAPDSEFAKTGLSPDEIRRRRIEAAKRTLAAIERAQSTINERSK